MPDIVISEFMDRDALGDFGGRYDLLYDPELVDRSEDLAKAVTGARALIVRNRTQVRGDLLAAAAKLEVVGRLGVGLDNIDLAACAARNIEVCPATGANDAAVAEYAVTMVLVLLRGCYQASDAVVRGDWPRQASIGREAGGKRLGLVGFGGIARQVAERGRVLGMSVAAFDPFLPPAHPAWRNAERLELPALLESSDAISLHVPLTDETRNLIDSAALERMKSNAVLVNSARGGVVDEEALAAALRDGRLGGAALDVFNEEPLTGDSGQRFAGVRNLILTPHIAGVTIEANVRVSAVTVENIKRVLEAGA